MEANHIETVWIPYKNEEIGKHTLIAVNQQALTQTAREGRRGGIRVGEPRWRTWSAEGARNRSRSPLAG